MKHLTLALLSCALVLSLSAPAEAQPQEAHRGSQRSPAADETPSTRGHQGARRDRQQVQGERSPGNAQEQRRPRRAGPKEQAMEGRHLGSRDGVPTRAKGSRGAGSQRPRSGRNAQTKSPRRQEAMKRGRRARQLRGARGRSGIERDRPGRAQRDARGAFQPSGARRAMRQRAAARRPGTRPATGQAPKKVERQGRRRAQERTQEPGSRPRQGRAGARRSRR